MRMQFGLRTLLLLFVAAAFCIYFFRNGCETWEINRVRREMPDHGFSLKYEQHGEGLLYTMITSRETILGIRVQVQDAQHQVHYDSGRIAVEEKYVLKFLLRNQQSTTDPDSADFLQIQLPPTLQRAKYQLTDRLNPPKYIFAADGCNAGHIYDEQRRHYDLWITIEPQSEQE